MDNTEKLKVAAMGAVTGAFLIALIGFGWAGWKTANSAAEMANDARQMALVEALTPQCLATAQADPNFAATHEALLAARGATQKERVIRESGWAGDSASRALLNSCANAVAAVEVEETQT